MSEKAKIKKAFEMVRWFAASVSKLGEAPEQQREFVRLFGEAEEKFGMRMEEANQIVESMSPGLLVRVSR